jgi:AraC-like DNA-binding protein
MGICCMSVFAPSLSSLWRQIEDHGIDPEPLFTKHGIGADIRFDPNARVSYAKSDQIMAAAAQQTGDPLFGLKEAEYFLPTHIGPLGFAWLASTSLRTAMERLQRYARVIHEKMQIDLQDHKSALIVTISASIPSANAYQRDSGFLSVLTRMCRHIYGDEWSPLAVTIAHPSPADTSGFYSYFRCPVEFDANENSLHIDLRQAAERLTGSNRQLAQLNDHIVVRYLAALSRDDIINQVKTDILEKLGEGNVTEFSVAQSLHMSTRNLNRKLKAEDTSFKNLLLEIRTELAHQYVSDATLTLTEISYMLGFSEISSFSRAYRRWTGRSPSAAREMQLN